MALKIPERALISGDEAVALAALNAGVLLGTGYPGTPSTEILEAFALLGGKAQWAPNEKVALEVGVGAAFGGVQTGGNSSAIVDGAAAVLVASALLSFYGHWWPIAAYFSLMAAIGLVTTFFAPETRGRDLNLPEDAI